MDEINFSLLRRHGITRAIRKALLENKKIDNSYFRGLGKGNWAFTLIKINKNRLKVESVDSEEILYDFLNQVIPNQKVKLETDLFICFFNKSKEEEKKLKYLLVKLDFKLGIESKKTKEDTSIRMKSSLYDSKDKALEILESLLKLRKMTSPYVEDIKIKIENDNISILLQIEDNTVIVESNISKKKIIGILNSLFVADNKGVPCTYDFYAKIEKINGGWSKGKREGYLMQTLRDKRGGRTRKITL